MRIGNGGSLGSPVGGNDELLGASGYANARDSGRANTQRDTSRNAARWLRVVRFFR